MFDLSIPTFEKKTANFTRDPAMTLSLTFDSEDSQMGLMMNIEAKK